MTFRLSLIGQADMLDKYAERTVDGVLHRELIGVYDNYEIQSDNAITANLNPPMASISTCIADHQVQRPIEQSDTAPMERLQSQSL